MLNKHMWEWCWGVHKLLTSSQLATSYITSSSIKHYFYVQHAMKFILKILAIQSNLISLILLPTAVPLSKTDLLRLVVSILTTLFPKSWADVVQKYPNAAQDNFTISDWCAGFTQGLRLWKNNRTVCKHLTYAQDWHRTDTHTNCLFKHHSKYESQAAPNIWEEEWHGAF